MAIFQWKIVWAVNYKENFRGSLVLLIMASILEPWQLLTTFICKSFATSLIFSAASLRMLEPYKWMVGLSLKCVSPSMVEAALKPYSNDSGEGTFTPLEGGTACSSSPHNSVMKSHSSSEGRKSWKTPSNPIHTLGGWCKITFPKCLRWVVGILNFLWKHSFAFKRSTSGFQSTYLQSCPSVWLPMNLTLKHQGLGGCWVGKFQR